MERKEFLCGIKRKIKFMFNISAVTEAIMFIRDYQDLFLFLTALLKNH